MLTPYPYCAAALYYGDEIQAWTSFTLFEMFTLGNGLTTRTSGGDKIVVGYSLRGICHSVYTSYQPRIQNKG